MFLKRSQTSLTKVAFVLFALSLLMLAACAPKIIRFTPERGPVGTKVTIIGKNFKDTPAENIVKFAGVEATDISVPEPEQDKIIAVVPPGAETGLISITTSDGTGYSKKNFVIPQPIKWTFMVYLDADNDLESAGIDDFLEMASIGSSDEVKIVVQMDRHPDSAFPYTNSYGDWTGTMRFLIQKGDTPSVTPVQDLGEQNMGDPAVLRAFVEWAVTNYPAEHYALVIWDHGDGWRDLREKMIRKVRAARSIGEPDWEVARAVSVDETSDGDKLFMREVQNALEAAKPLIKDRYGTLVKLDVVGFDACLMGMVEVAYAMRNVANYVVGSENLEPFKGWPYDAILGQLVATPSFSPRDLSGLIVTEYVDFYPTSSGITQSAVDIAELSNVVFKINAFTNVANTEWDKLKESRNNSLAYHSWGTCCWGVDLCDFAHNVHNKVTSPAIKTAASELIDAINAFVTNEHHSSDMAGSHGIAIYFPPNLTAFNNDPDHAGYEQGNNYMIVDFVWYHRWDNWLQDFYANIP